MKRIFKTLGILFLAIFFILLSVAIFIHFRGIPTYESGKVNLTVPLTEARIKQGQKLASVMCVECHYGKDGKLSGKLLPDLPKSFGTIYSRNITNDKETGIGSWTDGELYYLLRTGVGKDGKYIPPYMVKFPNASEEDIFSIIAWLRSDNAMLQASKEEPPTSEPSFLTKFLCLVAFKPLPINMDAIPPPDTTNALTYGKYLTSVYQCYECHSADFKTNNQLEPEKSIGYFGGGNQLLTMEGLPIYAPNITFGKNGIGHYSSEQFLETMRSGKKPDGAQFRYPMIPHSLLTDKELTAMFTYLKSVPAIDK